MIYCEVKHLVEKEKFFQKICVSRPLRNISIGRRTASNFFFSYFSATSPNTFGSSFCNASESVVKPLTLSCILSKNGQTYFKNRTMFTARFLKYVSPFFNILHERVRTSFPTISRGPHQRLIHNPVKHL